MERISNHIKPRRNSERNRVGPSGDALSNDWAVDSEAKGSPAGAGQRGPLAPLQGRMRASKEKESGWVCCPFTANDRNPTDTALVSRKESALVRVTKMSTGLWLQVWLDPGAQLLLAGNCLSSNDGSCRLPSLQQSQLKEGTFLCGIAAEIPELNQTGLLSVSCPTPLRKSSDETNVEFAAARSPPQVNPSQTSDPKAEGERLPEVLAGRAGSLCWAGRSSAGNRSSQEESPEGEERNAVGESLPLAGLVFRGGGGTPPHQRREDGWEDPSVTPSPGSLHPLCSRDANCLQPDTFLDLAGRAEMRVRHLRAPPIPTSVCDSLRRRGPCCACLETITAQTAQDSWVWQFSRERKRESQRVAPRWSEGARTLGVIPSAPLEVGELQMGGSETPCPLLREWLSCPFKAASVPLHHCNDPAPPHIMRYPSLASCGQGHPCNSLLPRLFCLHSQERTHHQESYAFLMADTQCFLNCTRGPDLPCQPLRDAKLIKWTTVMTSLWKQ